MHVGSHLSPVLLYRSYTCTTWHVFMSQSCAYPRADKATSVWKKRLEPQLMKEGYNHKERERKHTILSHGHLLPFTSSYMYKKRTWPISRPTKTLIIAFIQSHNLSSSVNKAWKKFRLEQDLNPWNLRYWCSALPNELCVSSQLKAGHIVRLTKWLGWRT